MTQFLAGMAPAFGCHADREFWPRVDISYFDRCGGDEWAEWSREAAIEHEAQSDWTHEVCKLIEINAGLKVLIAYPADRNEIDAVLNKLPAIHQSRKYVSSPCKYLFIFGPGEGLDDFVAFTFDGTAVADITGDTKITTGGAHP
jgi:hypothetical protein